MHGPGLTQHYHMHAGRDHNRARCAVCSMGLFPSMPVTQGHAGSGCRAPISVLSSKEKLPVWRLPCPPTPSAPGLCQAPPHWSLSMADFFTRLNALQFPRCSASADLGSPSCGLRTEQGPPLWPCLTRGSQALRLPGLRQTFAVGPAMSRAPGEAPQGACPSPGRDPTCPHQAA